ncbi:MAG: hypothetical protein AAF740_02630 [Bacteroidota bacterium]
MPKKLFLLIAIYIWSTCTFAQSIEKGTILLGGGLNASYNESSFKVGGNTTDGVSLLLLNFTPSVGYFFADGLVFGLGAQLSAVNESIPNQADSQWVGSLSLAPFSRYYSGDTNLFAQVQGFFGTGLEENANTVLGWSVGGGYVAFLNDNVSIEPTISYFRQSSNIDTIGNNDVTSRNSGIQLGVSFGIYLR